MYCADMASSLFGSLHVLRWHGTELIWEPSRVALAWHRAHLGTFMCCAGMAPSCLGIFHVALAWH